MVATVDGRAWESNWTKASGGIIGPSDVLYVGGFGDSLEITLALPGPVPALGTYRLADGSKGNALVSVLTATGWIVYYTDKGHFGYVTVSRADSTIAGDFYFDTWNGSAAVVIMVPKKETACPAHSRRKSAEMRSGVTSTSKRRMDAQR